MSVVSEVEELAEVFRLEYGFHVIPRELPSDGQYAFVERMPSHYKHQYAAPDNFLIIYYAGHGGFSPKQRLGLVPWG